MVSSDRAPDGYVRRDLLTALLTGGLAVAVLLVGVDAHAMWDPWELDALLRPPSPAVAALGALGLGRRAALAVLGCAIVVVGARGAALLGGRRAALVTASVLLAMPGLVLSARLATGALGPSLGAVGMVVGAIGLMAPGRWRARWIDGALLLGGAGLLCLSPPGSVVAPALAVGAGLLRRRPRVRGALVALTAAGLATGAAFAASHTLERPPESWASALEPAVYGVLPWLPLAPWAVLSLAGRAGRHAGTVAVVVWALMEPWLGQGALWLPLSITCGVFLARRRRLAALTPVALGIALALGLDVHRSAGGLLGVAAGAPIEAPPTLAEGWSYVGFAGLLLVALAALAPKRAWILGATCAASLAVGLVLGHAWLNALGAHLGHDDLFAPLDPDAPLAVLDMPPRSARRWTTTEPRILRGADAIGSFLRAPERAFAVALRERWCALRQGARARGGTLHAVGSDARYLLLSNRAGARGDHDFLGEAITSAPRDLGPPLARLDGVDLVELELPSSVRRGETVEATLRLRVRERLPRAMRVFVHVDGPGPRIQGDHDPVEGLCPSVHWLPGDLIADRFTFTAGGLTQPPGRYAVHVGLYWGAPGRWQNLRVLAGPHDDFDRVSAGELVIR